MATVMKATYKLLLYSLIHQLNGNHLDTATCHIPHVLPGCGNEICEMEVCKMKPECCNNAWDETCVNIACDINNCVFKAPDPPRSRKLLQTLCSNEPCPGNQHRNATTCHCQCSNAELQNANSCPGHQIFSNVLCECGCAIAPTCNTPQQFNTISCHCQCPPTMPSCAPTQHFNAMTCQCTTTTAPVTNCAATDTLDPCPGSQQRNQITCNCECDRGAIDSCPGQQEFNHVSCDCQCPITPTCSSPKQFNPTSCLCQCDSELQCGEWQTLDTETCSCQDNGSQTCANIGVPCPGGIQTRNPLSCECECENTQQCVGQQDFNILCECQCGTTPICKAFQQFNAVSCECQCIAPPVCNLAQILDVDTCQCMTPGYVCGNAMDPCPGNQRRNAQSCQCECGGEADAVLQCPGNQQFNVFCECGCAVTPICTALQQFDDISCQCQCLQELACGATEVFDTDKCLCTVTSEPTTTNPTLSPSTPPSAAPTTANPTTTAPTTIPSNNPTPFPTNNPSNSPTTSPNTAVPTTQIPTFVPSDNPSYDPTRDPTDYPTELPSMQPSVEPSDHPTTFPTIPPTVSPTKLPSFSPTLNPTKSPSSSPTFNPSKARIYQYSETFICELTPVVTTNSNTLIVDDLWAMEAIKELIHFSDIIISSTRIRITNIFSMDGHRIVIEYNLETDRMELFDIIGDNVENLDILMVNQQMFNIISNEIVTTTTAEPATTLYAYPYKKTLIFRLGGDYEALSQYVNAQNSDVYSWAMQAVEALIHYKDEIIFTETKIVINNVIPSSFGVEYTLEMKRIEIFDIILNNIESTLSSQMLIVGNHMFYLVSNEIMTTCGYVGEECNSIIKCCGDDGVRCMAESANINNENGVCCIDYNNDGCVADNDCCYDNSYCDDGGICQRILSERSQVDGGMHGKYADAKAQQEQLLDDYEDYDMDTTKYIALSASVKIALCVLIIIVLFVNVMCCVWDKWKKLKKGKSAKTSVDINII